MKPVHTWLHVHRRGVAIFTLPFAFLLGVTPNAIAQQSFAIFIVDSATDWFDANPGDGNCVALPPKPWLPLRWCTLRAAIEGINAGSQANTISPAAGMYGLTAQLAIRKDVHLWGSGAARSTIDGNHAYRMPDIAFGAWADISEVMIQKAKPNSLLSFHPTLTAAPSTIMAT